MSYLHWGTNTYNNIKTHSSCRARVRIETSPVGSIMNSCMANLFPAWLPPFITLNAGHGRITSLLPARSATWRYSGTPLCAAPALQTANETPRIALAPSLLLFSVPSSSSMILSTAVCWVTSMFLEIRAGAMMELTLSTAFKTPLPRYRFGSLSLSSRAS